MEELQGRAFGKYQIGTILGRGNRAAVYQATDEITGTFVALRVIDRALSGDSAFEMRFRRIMAIVANLSHPNILPMLDHGIQDGFAFLARPLVSTGPTLRGLFGTPLAPEQASALLRPVASALDYAHSRGVTHCDLKPGSILLPYADRPLVSDLGIAPMSPQANNVIATAKGLNFGTPEYLAPEQVQGVAIDHRVDLYSFGVVLYEALVGRPPFHAESPTDTPRQVAFSHLALTPPAPRTVNPALSPAVEQVLMRSLEKRPDRRYPTSLAMIDALEAAQYGHDSHTSPHNGAVQAVQSAPIQQGVRPSVSEAPQSGKPARGWGRTRI